MLKKPWQDWATLIAGVWFALAPWAMGHGDAAAGVLYNAVIVGGAIALFSAGALAKPQAWEEVIDFLIGVWAIASPWALGYNSLRDLTTNAVVIGAIVAVLALWTATQRSDFIERWRKHPAA